MLSSLYESLLHREKSHSAVCYLLHQIYYQSPDSYLSLAHKQRSVLQDHLRYPKIGLISVSGEVSLLRKPVITEPSLAPCAKGVQIETTGLVF